MLRPDRLWYKKKSPKQRHLENFGCFRLSPANALMRKADKKRPNTIPVFGPGKWLLGESRALKVGINAG
jgi:hypothetical protein